jgi:hypothetical protein
MSTKAKNQARKSKTQKATEAVNRMAVAAEKAKTAAANNTQAPEAIAPEPAVTPSILDWAAAKDGYEYATGTSAKWGAGENKLYRKRPSDFRYMQLKEFTFVSNEEAKAKAAELDAKGATPEFPAMQTQQPEQ